MRGMLSDTNSDGYMDTSTGSGKAWDLDVLGNWNNVTGETGDRQTNSQNELTQVNGSTLTYDADGNMTWNGVAQSCAYDAWNRLVEVNNDNGEGDYAYDALGRRIVESPVGGITTTNLYYSDQWQVIEERQSGNVTGRYVWSANYPNALVFRQQDANGNGQFDTSEQLWVTYDANYNVTSVMGVDAPMERFTYDPYGNNRAVFGSTWYATTDAYNWIYGFQGGRLDPSTGLYTFQRRDYDPTLGRWDEQDPAQYIDGPNMYQMEGSDPIDSLDPVGTFSINWKGQWATWQKAKILNSLGRINARIAMLLPQLQAAMQMLPPCVVKNAGLIDVYQRLRDLNHLIASDYGYNLYHKALPRGTHEPVARTKPKYKFWNAWTLFNDAATPLPWDQIADAKFDTLFLHELAHVAEGYRNVSDQDYSGDLDSPYYIQELMNTDLFRLDKFKKRIKSAAKKCGCATTRP